MSRTGVRVLLLNPPAPRPVFRDAYCSGPSKGPLLAAPLDLQVQSGFFHEAGFPLEFVDAVVSGRTEDEALAEARSARPDVVLALAGAYSWRNDAAFLARLKSALPSHRLFLTGDLARFDAARVWSDVPSADGVLRDFASPALRDHLVDARPSGELLLRPALPPSPEIAPAAGRLEIPSPAPAVVAKYRYRLPFFARPRCYSILASYGCPFPCRYCNAHLVGFRLRDPGAFAAELRHAAALGLRSLYVRDATFAVNRQWTLELFRAWERERPGFEWICFTRPDLLDEELIERAARLGCRVMMLGVESTDEGWLRDMNRRPAPAQVGETFRRLRREGIRTAAQMMVGVDDATGEADRDYERRLLGFLEHLDPDFVSLNVFTRRPGLVVDHPRLSQVEARRADYEALAARVNRAFYFRPRVVLRQLRHLRPSSQLPLLARLAWHLARPQRGSRRPRVP